MFFNGKLIKAQRKMPAPQRRVLLTTVDQAYRKNKRGKKICVVYGCFFSGLFLHFSSLHFVENVHAIKSCYSLMKL